MKNETAVSLSVIVATADRCDDCRRLFASLVIQSRLPDEIVVIDASDDEATRQLCREYENHPVPVRYFTSSRGLPAQRNTGIAAARGEFLYFLDDDVVLEPDCIAVVDRLLRAEGNADIGGVMGQVTNSPRHTPWFDLLFKNVFLMTDRGRGTVKPSGLPSIQTGERACDVQSLTGCFMVYRRAVCDTELFDEKLTGYAYMEDVDFSWRVGRHWRLRYEPAARLVHNATTFRTVDTRVLRKMFVVNHRYLFKKNMPQDALHRLAFCWSVAGSLLYNLLVQRDVRACRGIIDGLRSDLPC